MKENFQTKTADHQGPMKRPGPIMAAAAASIYFAFVTCAFATTRIEMIRNDEIVAYDEIVHPAETEAPSSGLPNVTVYLNGGTLETTSTSGKSQSMTVKRGGAVFRGPRAGLISNTGTAEIRFIRIEFLGKVSAETWGTNGFAPSSTLILENGYARVYDIRVPAGVTEPQHTHHDRVVVCLSGALLKHILPDGHEENSSLKTNDCLWRRAQTHVGKNLGKTDLWVIAVEPKGSRKD
jgi:hypothetical protein